MTATAVTLAWAPAAAYMALIWTLSSFHLRTTLVQDFPMRDKGIHFCEYAVLGFLVTHAVLRTWPWRPWVRLVAFGVLLSSAWGLLDEMHQALVPGREPDLLDFAADTLGSLGGAVAYLSTRHLFKKRAAAQRATTSKT